MLILPSQPSSPGLTGYLDRDEPHAINYLIVQKLGKDEVIATVRDDGDVDVTLVRHVVHAINTRLSSAQAVTEPIADNVKPLFQRNVGISAWGLAIHSQARIIAVSSNRHEVTIFRFGLVDDARVSRSPRSDSDVGEDLGDPQEELGDRAESARPKRSADVTRQVLNGEANIPHIAFCNTGDDPHGRWLLTTDISGVCRAIDLHKFALVQAFRFGPAFGTPLGGSYDRMNAGWGIMFLDTRSFVAQGKISAALGLEDGEALPDAQSDQRIWDLSRTTRHLPDLSNAFIEPRLKGPKTPPREVSRSTSNRSSGANSPLANQSAVAANNITATLTSVLEHAADASSDDEDEEDAGVPVDQPDPPGSETTSAHGETSELVDVEMWSDLEDSEDEPTEDSIHPAAYYSAERVCGNVPQFVRSTDLCEDLPCPILHTSIRNIYLLQPSKQRLSRNNPFLPPLVGMAAPLKQSIQAEYRGLNMFDRLSMHAYIPTLGVVVLASQKGRAVVLSLAQVPQEAHVPDGFDPTLGLKTNYTLRAECVLPFEAQERAGQRPFSPLHGIAVGPVQGAESVKDESRRKWRLMMMFQDHSILSYEIRRTGARVGVGNVVV